VVEVLLALEEALAEASLTLWVAFFAGGKSLFLATPETPPPDGSASSLGTSIWTWVWANWLTASFGRTRPAVGDNQFFLFSSASPSIPDLRYSSLICAVFPLPSADC